jgi:hypothetical protein
MATILQAPNAGIAYTNRDVAPQASSCLFTNGDGCEHADASRSIGTVSLAGLPASLPGGPPAGWAGYLVRVSNFADSVSAEAGVGTSAPTVATAGTISYWNGAGYSTLSLAPGPSVAIPVAPLTIITGGGPTFTVTISATLATGGTSTSSTIMTCSPTPCPNNRSDATATSASPIIGTISYKVVRNATTVADVTLTVNLGQLEATSTYKPTTAS